MVLCISFIVRILIKPKDTSDGRPPILPLFAIGFFVLATLNSLGFIPVWSADFAGVLSRWALLVAVAAVGNKTSLGRMVQVGPAAIALVFVETIFLGVLILCGLLILGR
ncbi:putative sulfate exporter family transporter [Pseudorhodobacter turbinis]|uniref:putative sulfate exporter family transporter n=1 Tax=Pseudorhodobacter turbinis TaxID=2500533 RepID=UPI001F0E4B84|nr:putative sulfate exporter family transporter [Pseudorhodobacter turbinis]